MLFNRRPRTTRLDVSLQAKKRPAPKARKPRAPRAPKTRRKKVDSNLAYWIACGIALLVGSVLLVYAEIPLIKSWASQSERPASAPAPGLSSSVPPPPSFAPVPAPVKPLIPMGPPAPPAPQVPTPPEQHPKTQRELADEATQKLVESTAPKPGPLPVAPPVPPAPIVPLKGSQPPVVSVEPEKLTAGQVAAYQTVLERLNFSCGFIDGDQGMRTQRMLRAFQSGRGLPVTGVLDPATRDEIGEPGETLVHYTVTEVDVASIMPKPGSWREMSKAPRLGYNNIWEMLAEKFHCTRAYLKLLNGDVSEPVAGTEIIGPRVSPAAPIHLAASLRILLSETSIEALDDDGKIIAFFPCSIAKDKNKRPHGMLTVKVLDPNPDYTFDPELFADASKAEGITHKMTIPPGPRNPVGTTWIGLSLPGYGIHGTPEPENISRTQSHGCFRLANWNAEKVLKMVKIGTPVDVEP